MPRTLCNINMIGYVGSVNSPKENISIVSIAHTAKFKDEERTEWFNVLCFQHNATYASSYISKGDLVFVDGRFQTSEYEGKTKLEILCRTLQVINHKEEDNFSKKSNSAIPF